MHVLEAGNEAKVWLGPVRLAYARGYNDPEVTRILGLLSEHQGQLLNDGMSTSIGESPPAVGAVDVKFAGALATFVLSDARSIVVDLRRVEWLGWLLSASPARRRKFILEEPGGFAVYWPELDDGVEVAHLLSQGSI